MASSSSCLLRLSGRESSSDLRAAHLKRCALSYTSPEFNSLQLAGSFSYFTPVQVVLQDFMACCESELNWAVAVFRDQDLSGPFLISLHQLFSPTFISLSFFEDFFSADLMWNNRVLAGGGGIFVADLARKSAFSLPRMSQWLGIHCC
jgi:hypothetical protein